MSASERVRLCGLQRERLQPSWGKTERERDREIDRRGICTVFQPRGESVLTQRGEVSLYD